MSLLSISSALLLPLAPSAPPALPALLSAPAIPPPAEPADPPRHSKPSSISSTFDSTVSSSTTSSTAFFGTAATGEAAAARAREGLPSRGAVVEDDEDELAVGKSGGLLAPGEPPPKSIPIPIGPSASAFLPPVITGETEGGAEEPFAREDEDAEDEVGGGATGGLGGRASGAMPEGLRCADRCGGS